MHGRVFVLCSCILIGRFFSRRHQLVDNEHFDRNKGGKSAKEMERQNLDHGAKGGLPLGKMSGDFAPKFIWACGFLFVYSLAGEIFLFKIVKMDLTNWRRKNSPQLFDQPKRKYISVFAVSANAFQSHQVKGDS